jgi:hypothetical protein
MIQTIVLPKALEQLDHVLCQSAIIARGKFWGQALVRRPR